MKKILVIVVYFVTLLALVFGVYTKVTVSDFENAVLLTLIVIITVQFVNTYLLIRKD